MKSILITLLLAASCGFAQTHKTAMLESENRFAMPDTTGFPIRVASPFNIYGNNQPLLLENPAASGFGWGLAILDEAPDYPVGFNYTGIAFWALKLYPDGRLSADGVIKSGNQPVSRWLGQAASNPTSPRGGDQYYNTATAKVRLYTGSAWVDLN
jgi:hypothetical protein